MRTPRTDLHIKLPSDETVLCGKRPRWWQVIVIWGMRPQSPCGDCRRILLALLKQDS